MTPAVRRTIDELVTLYELEPGIRDVFVEGASDRAVLDWYLRHRTPATVSVWEVDCVDVPSNMVEKYKLDVGNRGRLIALAYELADRLDGGRNHAATVVVDCDFDCLLGVAHACPLLVLTDYSCLEMYLFNERIIGKFLSVVTMGCSQPTGVVLTELAKVLQRLFAIRLANHGLGWGMTWLSFERTCECRDGVLQFGETEFIRRYLLKNQRIKDFDTFRQQLQKINTHGSLKF